MEIDWVGQEATAVLISSSVFPVGLATVAVGPDIVKVLPQRAVQVPQPIQVDALI